MMLMFVSVVFSLLSLVISENKVILNHINDREFLMLKCNITDDGCCQNMKEVDFFKNGKGVCTISDCKGTYVIPLMRDDTEYYRCGCVEREMNKSYLHVSKYRPSDFGNWTCGCFDKGGGRNCSSSVMVISKEIFEKDMKKSNQKSTINEAYLQYLLFFVGFVLAVIIVLVVGIIFLRRSVSKHVRPTRPTRLTKFLFGKNERADNSLSNIPLVTPKNKQNTKTPLVTPNDNQHGTTTPIPLVTPTNNQHRTTTIILLVNPNDNQYGTSTLIPLLTVTDRKLIRVDDAGLARREVQSLLDKIQNAMDDAGLARSEVQSLLRMQEIHNDLMDYLRKKDQDEVLSYLVKDFPELVLNATCNVDNKPDWCECGNCRNMKKKYHSVCCRNRGVEVGCFSQSQDFISKCLSKEALYNFYESIERNESRLKAHSAVALKEHLKLQTIQKYKYVVPDVTNRWFRALSYSKCKQILPVSGKELFTPVPSCCKLAIREVFPDFDCKYDT